MSDKVYFWNFISENKIEIPIIQRDYAQGRKDEKVEAIRNTFLDNLLDAIKNKKSLTLDFIYGTKKSGTFFPLDGQQRLTTLWLLHWYIAFKVGELANNVEIFKNFSYSTRLSSKEFCQKLCELKPLSENTESPISSQIQSQTWFYAFWKQDPTIQSMLVMLDTIEEKTKVSREDLKNYWQILLDSTVCTIRFLEYQMPVKEFKEPDDLYIKMNARGKPLTSFENFKADLIGYIEQKVKEDKNWEKLLDPKNGIPIKLDIRWTDIFWKNKFKDEKGNYKIDEIYFAFFNRYVLNEYCCSAKIAEKCENDKIFKSLYGKSVDDSEAIYSVFDNYKWISLELLNKISNVLDRVCGLDEARLKLLKKFDFIPTYEKDGVLSTLTQAGHVKFFAISAYFANGDFDETSFLRWMRVANNLIDNADIDNVPNMISHIKLIDELSKGSHSVYEHLTAENFNVQSNASVEQLKEEITKAKKILENSKWESKIVKAEKEAFFKGAIRFLFTDATGTVDWSQFGDKFETAQKYFDKDGVKAEYQKGAKLLRNFISYFTDWGKFGGWNYDNTKETWKNILISEDFFAEVHKLLTIKKLHNDFSSFTSSLTEFEEGRKEVQENVQNELVKTNILCYVPEKSYLKWSNPVYVIYPYNSKADWNKFVVGNHRNEILSELVDNGKVELINEDQRVWDDEKEQYVNFFWGWNISFVYKNIKFCWQYWNWVDAFKENGKQYKGKSFECKPDMDSKSFIKELNNLIEQISQ